MDISQIRQAALNSLYAHKKHLDSLRHKTDDDIEVIDVKPAMTKPMSLPLPRQKPTPYPRQHAPPPPVGAKPTFLGLLGDHPVYQSVFDLRRLGLRFDEILQQSGCSEAFLRDVFKQLGYSVELPVGAVPKVVTKALTVPPPGVSPRVMTFEEFRKTREASGTPSEPHTPSFHSPALTSHAFTPTISTPLVSVRSIPRFGEKSRRQKRLCIEISDSESDSDDALAKKHKDMSLEETRQEIARIQALIAQTSGAKNGHRESSEPNESSERSGTGEPSESHSEEEAVDVSATPVAASLAVSAAASPSLAHTKAVPSVPAPQLDPSVAAYLAAKNIALDSLTPVQLDKIVQIVKLKTLLQGEEDAFTTSLQKIPHTEIPSPAPRQPNSRDASGLDSEQGRDAAQQPPQPARVVSMANTDERSVERVSNAFPGVFQAAFCGNAFLECARLFVGFYPYFIGFLRLFDCFDLFL